jgi:hypothetical protein
VLRTLELNHCSTTLDSNAASAAALRGGPVRIEPAGLPGPGGSSGPEPAGSPAVLAWLAYWLLADLRERPW